ncbi:alpha-D-kanosaminyltransferase [bacterium BMS3Abin01]|nr:alpha-D-kanosaminyltransferase [bacterium BMS3Abin01]HDY69703.1 glycosyltransferase family 1 protein [Actinomycetota bacterium]
MRIGIEGLPLFFHRTGTFTYTHELVQNLRRLPPGDTVMLFGRNQRMAGSSYHDISYPERFANYFYKKYRLPCELLNRQVDIYHSPRDMGLPKPSLLPCPTVMTLHDIILVRMASDYYTPSRARLYERRLLQRVRQVDHIITASEFSRRDALDWSGIDPGKVSVVYNGVSSMFQPVTAVEELTRVSSRYDLPKRFILCVGATEPRKNVRMAIEAFQRLRQGRSDVRLVVTGGDYCRLDPSTAFAGQSLDDVHFAGYIADCDMAAVYSLAEVLLFPSLYEGFGLPPLEAMACRTPVVASNLTSIPEVVSDAAMLVNPLNTGEIAAALEMILSSGEIRRDLIDRGSARAAQFSWYRSAEQTREIYEKVIAGHA